ncbi:NUC189-domain-containing protein, partial [Decorospora gaudefroyi]
LPSTPATMPAVVANSRNGDRAPPAKKAKLSQHQQGLKALVNGTSAKPTAKRPRVENAQPVRVDDATAVVAGPGEVQMAHVGNDDIIEISSAEEESEDDLPDEGTQAGAQEEEAPATNGLAGSRHDDLEPEDITFGERLRAEGPVQESRIINVQDANPESQAMTPHARPLAPPSANSLGQVLTQALRTNDKELLESCLSVIDVESVYATVERLPSPLVGVLLQRLAERLHKKPGRAGMLMAWVQYSLAAHGGYLASQPQLVKQLAALNKVLKERSSGLMPLMSLKGRLDMLQAQLDLRKRNLQRAVNDDEETAVLYVEGEEDDVSSDDEADGNAAPGSQKRLRQDVEDEDQSSTDEMALNMEMDDDDEGSEGSDDDDDLIDAEAEETDNDDMSDSEPMSEALDGEDVSESEEDSKPERRSTAARAGLKSRR